MVGVTPTMRLQRAGSEPVVLGGDKEGNDHGSFIVSTGNPPQLKVVVWFSTATHTLLGELHPGPAGVKLKAIRPSLMISTGNAQDPRTKPYPLETDKNGLTVIFILRHGDVITSTEAEGRITCTWPGTDIQVNSSAAGESKSKAGITNIPEDDESEELDKAFMAVPVTQPKSQPVATPQLSHQPSVTVIHETPTTVRTFGASGPRKKGKKSGSLNETSPHSESEKLGFSTAPTGHSQHDETMPDEGDSKLSPKRTSMSNRKNSPETRENRGASKKRPNPGSNADQPEGEEIMSSRNKRTKKSMSKDGPKNNDQSDAPVDSSGNTRPPRGKKRLSEVTEGSPMRTTRGLSQQSATSTTAEAYDGPIPHVVFSNSAIDKSNASVRFLKKNKGTVSESVEKDCNILCTRDGTLVKTLKIVQAIALGIPIVADKWLQDSATVGRFLELSAYRPSFPEQEKEWGFDFAKVWSQPQAIFEGRAIYFTPGFKDKGSYGPMCKAAGAKVTNSKKQAQDDNTIIIAKEDDDDDAEKFMQDGVACYTKDILTTSILRGKVDLDSDEFKISNAEVEVATKKTRRST